MDNEHGPENAIRGGAAMKSPTGGAGDSDPFAQNGPRILRFRARREGQGDSTLRRYQATYSHSDGWSRFTIELDIAQNSLTLRRYPDDDYQEMLLDLAGRPPTIPRIPAPKNTVDSLGFDMEVIGFRMATVQREVTREGRSGDWTVVKAYLPGGADSFLLGTNEPLAAGEILIPRPESTRTVVLTLAKVFG